MILLVVPLAVFVLCLALRFSPVSADAGWTVLFVILLALVAAAAFYSDQLGTSPETLLGAAALAGVLGTLALAAGLVMSVLRSGRS